MFVTLVKQFKIFYFLVICFPWKQRQNERWFNMQSDMISWCPVCLCLYPSSGDDWHCSECQWDEEACSSYGRDWATVELSSRQAHYETLGQPGHHLTRLRISLTYWTVTDRCTPCLEYWPVIQSCLLPEFIRKNTEGSLPMLGVVNFVSNICLAFLSDLRMLLDWCKDLYPILLGISTFFNL